MPEGHTIHRAALDHRRFLLGHALQVSSPQGRFTEGAAMLDERACRSIEAFGKHLLYGFDGGIWLHIHLGLFGRFRIHSSPASTPKGAVRVRLGGPAKTLDIHGPNTCELLNEAALQELLARIGPDVLRNDADANLAYKRIAKSRAAIGQLLMDQSVIAGIGNIYRTEILWRCRVHPQMPGRSLSRTSFDALWSDAQMLLAEGVRRNAIVTVEKAISKPGRGRYRERVNIFGKESCPRCANTIHKFEIAGRTAYMCEACQTMGNEQWATNAARDHVNP